MKNFIDWYEVLELSARATDEVIKAAHKALTLRYHPDRRSGSRDARKMSLINQARDILLDPEKRARFDLEREDSLAGKTQRPKDGQSESSRRQSEEYAATHGSKEGLIPHVTAFLCTYPMDVDILKRRVGNFIERRIANLGDFGHNAISMDATNWGVVLLSAQYEAIFFVRHPQDSIDKKYGITMMNHKGTMVESQLADAILRGAKRRIRKGIEAALPQCVLKGEGIFGWSVSDLREAFAEKTMTRLLEQYNTHPHRLTFSGSFNVYQLPCIHVSLQLRQWRGHVSLLNCGSKGVRLLDLCELYCTGCRERFGRDRRVQLYGCIACGKPACNRHEPLKCEDCGKPVCWNCAVRKTHYLGFGRPTFHCPRHANV